MPFSVVPVAIGGGALLLTGVGLRIRALSKKDKNKPTIPIAGGLTPPVNPTLAQQQAFDQQAFDAASKQPATQAQVDAACAAAGVSTTEWIEALTLFSGGRANFKANTGVDSPEMLARINVASGSTPNQIADDVAMLRQTKQGGANTLTPSTVTPGAVGPATTLTTQPTGKQAVVTTKDAPPSGDLIVRDAPNGSQIGGADKGGTVTVLQDVDGIWAQVAWQGGRWPAVTGFAKKAFLRVV